MLAARHRFEEQQAAGCGPQYMFFDRFLHRNEVADEDVKECVLAP
jgi:hypothetical protein